MHGKYVSRKIDQSSIHVFMKSETVVPTETCLNYNISDQAVALWWAGQGQVDLDRCLVLTNSQRWRTVIYLMSNFWYEDAKQIIFSIWLLLFAHALMQDQNIQYVFMDISLLLTVYVFCNLCSIKELRNPVFYNDK